MRTFGKRVWVALLAIVCGTVGGGLAGYLLGRTYTLTHGETGLETYAARIIDEGEKSFVESRKVLAAMQASSLPPCSDAEIASFSRMVFESQYLKAAGRMRDGRIECSTSFGRAIEPGVQYKPDILQRDGTKMYRNLAPFRVKNETVISIQLGDSFIVYSPYNITPLLNDSMQLTVTNLDALERQDGRLLGAPLKIADAFLVHNGHYRDKSLLYGTHCSPDGIVCVTAHVPVEVATQRNRPEIGGFMALGGLTGLLLGVVCAAIYRRQQGIQHQLRRAIRNDALRIVYQPIVDLETEQIVEVEALSRWTNEDNVPVSPDDFIRVAEQGGFVGQITRLVVRQVLRDFGQLLRERAGFRVNVNVAAADLADPEFLPMLEEALAGAGVPACALGIEITESYTARQQVAKETILRLREKGHFVYIDDFGTGYSSLAYLHDLSVDAIKIDKAFTKAIGTDAVTVSILPQILTMADTLGLRVIVEGIETREQARYFSAAEQPVYAQGWLFGRPAPADAFHRLLKSNEAGEPILESIESVAGNVAVAASTVPAA